MPYDADVDPVGVPLTGLTLCTRVVACANNKIMINTMSKMVSDFFMNEGLIFISIANNP